MFISCACIFNSVFRTETNFPFIPQSDFLKKIERKKKFCFFAFRFRDFVIERNDSRSVSKFRDSTIKKKKKKVVREEIGGNFDSSPILAFPSLLHRSTRIVFVKYSGICIKIYVISVRAYIYLDSIRGGQFWAIFQRVRRRRRGNHRESATLATRRGRQKRVGTEERRGGRKWN